MRRSQKDAFPFETEDPNGVPGATNIQSDAIETIVGHVSTMVEGAARVETRGAPSPIARIVQSTAAQMGPGVKADTGVAKRFRASAAQLNMNTASLTSARGFGGGSTEGAGWLAAQEINVRVTVISFPDWLPQGVLSKASTVTWSIETPL